ncbi:MAG: DNA adenine methylase [Candidatus Thermochlorobacter sp.]
MIKSPLRYPGGKSRAIKLIATLVPRFDEYREPFLGGGSLFLYLKQKFPNKKFWVNDLHFPLFKFWQMCERNVDAVVKKIYEWRESFQDGKEMHTFLTRNLSTFSDLETAAAFFIINRITFSGTSESGGYSEQAFRGRFTESSIKRLKPFGNVIKGTRITNSDFQQVVEQDGENVFLFLDPPYYSATKSALYGKNGNLHKRFDHVRFAETMKKCKHRWLLTYDDSPYTRELFSFANIFTWDLMYGMRNVTNNSNQRERELFISNYLTVLPEQKEQQLSLLDEIERN